AFPPMEDDEYFLSGILPPYRATSDLYEDSVTGNERSTQSSQSSLSTQRRSTRRRKAAWPARSIANEREPTMPNRSLASRRAEPIGLQRAKRGCCAGAPNAGRLGRAFRNILRHDE